MISRHVIALGLLFSGLHVHAQSLSVAPELWDRPRSARTVMAEAAVRQAVNGYLAHPAARLVIHHAAAQEVLLQAEELKSWLVALAVEPQRIAFQNDLKSGEPLRIEIVSTP